MASLLYSSYSILKTCSTRHIIAPYTWNFFPLNADTLRITRARSSDKQFTRCRLPRNCSTILWCTEALRWTGQQQDEVERVAGGGKSSIVSIEGKKLKDPSRTYTWAPLTYYTLLSSVLIFRIANEIPLLILKATISSVRTEPKLGLQEWM